MSATPPELREPPDRLLAMLSRSWPDLGACSGALLLLGSFFLLTRGIPFPGAWALPPVIGTCLLVAAGPRAWLNRHVLSQPAMVFFGLISYPLYLWHWPLLSFARLAGDGPPSVILRIALLLLSVLLAWITWRVIERPIRSGARRRWKVVAPLCCMAAAAAAGIAIVAAGGFDGRLNADVRRYANYAYDFEHDARSGTCWLAMENAPLAFPDDCIEPAGHGGVPLVVVWGDSHAARLTPGVRAIGRGRFRVAQFTRDGCRPFLGLGYPDCLAGNAGVLQTIRRLRPDYVVLFSFWTAPVLTDERALLDELQRTIAVLNASGVGQVIVVGPSAEWAGRQHALPRNLIRLYEHKPFRRAPARTLDGVNPIASRRDAAFAARLAGRDDVHYFSAYHAICNRQGCMTRAGDDPYELMTWDYGHLTTSGATYVARRLEAEIGGFRPHAGARAHLHAVDAITGRHWKSPEPVPTE